MVLGCRLYPSRVEAASAGVMPIASFVRFNALVANLEGGRQNPGGTTVVAADLALHDSYEVNWKPKPVQKFGTRG